jgi:hypothetical protein
MFRVLFCLLVALASWPRPAASTAIPLRILVLNSAEEAARVRRTRRRRRFRRARSPEVRGCYIADGGLRAKWSLHCAKSSEPPCGLAQSAFAGVPDSFRFAIVKVLAPDEFAVIADSQRARRAAIRAEGSIRFTVNVSGGVKASALANYAKPANWNTDLKLSCTMRQSFADLKARAKKLAAAADALATRLPIPWRCASAGAGICLSGRNGRLSPNLSGLHCLCRGGGYHRVESAGRGVPSRAGAVNVYLPRGALPLSDPSQASYPKVADSQSHSTSSPHLVAAWRYRDQLAVEPCL